MVAVLADTAGSGAFYPLMLVYLRLTTPYPLARIGLLLTAGTALGLVLGPLSGGLVDRFSARRGLVLNNLLSAAGYGLLFAVRSPAQLFAAVLLMALSERLYWSSWPVFVAERTAGRRLDQWYATINAVRSGSLGLGAAAAAAALSLGGTGVLRGLLLFNVATSLLSGVLISGIGAPGATSDSADRTRAVRDAGPTSAAAWRQVLADRRLVTLTSAHTAIAFAWLLPALVLPIYLVQTLRLPGWLASAAFVLNTAVTTLLQRWLVGRLAHLRRTRIVMLGAIALAMCVLLEALANGRVAWLAAALVLAGVLLLSVAESVVGPAVTALVMSIAPEDVRGRYSSFFNISWTVPNVVGPAIVGYLLGRSVWALWILLGVLVCAGGLAFLTVERHLPMGALDATDT
jgi:MFS family permease